CRRLRASSCSLTLFSYIHVPPPDLHSFPTRRSSDLPTPSRHAVPHGPEAHASTVVPRRTAGPAPRCSSRHRPRHRGGPPPSGLQSQRLFEVQLASSGRQPRTTVRHDVSHHAGVGVEVQVLLTAFLPAQRGPVLVERHDG